MDGSKRQREKMPLSIVPAQERKPVLQTVDKLIMTTPGELVIIYSHRSPVSICAEDAYSLYQYLQTVTPLRYDEFKVAMSNDLEDTKVA